VLKKLKRKKAPGPDGIPNEIWKEMDYINRIYLLKLLNEWYLNETIAEEDLLAHVVLIFKKGDTSNLENYRPIALLNTFYKIFAALLQQRIEKAIDNYIQPNQYGFRKNKSTADAIHAIRRAMEFGEKTGKKNC